MHERGGGGWRGLRKGSRAGYSTAGDDQGLGTGGESAKLGSGFPFGGNLLGEV